MEFPQNDRIRNVSPAVTSFGALAPVALTGLAAMACVWGIVTDRFVSHPLVDAAAVVLLAAFCVALAFSFVRLRTILAATAEVQESLTAELDRRDRFWSSAAHDVKSHIASIGLRSQLIKKKLQAVTDDPSDPLLRGLDEIRSTSKRVSTILTELQDVARLNMGVPLALEMRSTDLVALAQAAVAEAQMMSNQRRTFVLDAGQPAIVGYWDEVRIGRVLSNLLDNAIKYSQEDTEITVHVSEQHDAEGAWAYLSVEDTGIGIPESELPQLFERFHRARNVSATIPGTGLGLAGVRDIVEQHGGEVTVVSQEGAGSVFTIRLPLVHEISGAA